MVPCLMGKMFLSLINFRISCAKATNIRRGWIHVDVFRIINIVMMCGSGVSLQELSYYFTV
jgi:hypothetical protein